MKSVQRIGERNRSISSLLRNVCMWVKHDVCSPPRRPADRLRITPSLVTDDDAKSKRRRLKYPSALTGRVREILRRINLFLILPARQCTVGIDYQSSNQQTSRRHSF